MIGDNRQALCGGGASGIVIKTFLFGRQRRSKKSRILNADQDIITVYFDVLEETLRTHDLFESPHLILCSYHVYMDG